MTTKFTLLFSLALMFALLSKAQINKGSFALGGNLNFNTTTDELPGNKYTTTSVTVAPSFLSAYKDNRAFGFALRYTYDKTGYYKLKTNSYGAGAFLRQYKSLGKGFYVFAQEALNFDINEDKSILSGDTTYVLTKKYYITSITINPGLAFDVSRKFQLEMLFFNNLLSAGYSYSTSKLGNFGSYDKEKSFYINTNLDLSQLASLNIGAKIFFNR